MVLHDYHQLIDLPSMRCELHVCQSQRLRRSLLRETTGGNSVVLAFFLPKECIFPREVS